MPAPPVLFSFDFLPLPVGLGLVAAFSGPVEARAPVRPAHPFCEYLWLLKGCSDLSLGFPASVADIRKARSIFPPPRLIVFLLPPPPLLRSFAVVVAMDQSRDSSGDSNTNGKRGLDGSGDTSADSVAYEAELRAKLEQAEREQAAKEQEACGTQPPWLREEERRHKQQAQEDERMDAARVAPSGPPAALLPRALWIDLVGIVVS